MEGRKMNIREKAREKGRNTHKLLIDLSEKRGQEHSGALSAPEKMVGEFGLSKCREKMLSQS